MDLNFLFDFDRKDFAICWMLNFSRNSYQRELPLPGDLWIASYLSQKEAEMEPLSVKLKIVSIVILIRLVSGCISDPSVLAKF